MITFDYDETTGYVFVLMQTEAGDHRICLSPGQLDRAREILPDDLYAEVEALWTPEVIEAWREANVEPEPEPGSSAPEGYISDSEALRIVFGGGIND